MTIHHNFKSEKTLRILTYASPTLLALAVRATAFFFWWNSPIHLYNTEPGLDMLTCLTYGEKCAQYGTFNSLYDGFVALAVIIGHNQFNQIAIIVASQMALGAAVACMTTWIAFILFQKRILATMAGCLIAIYGPLLFYESFCLRETLFLFLSTLSLTFLVVLSRKNTFFPNFLIGLSLPLPMLVRFSGALWILLGLAWTLLIEFPPLKNVEKSEECISTSALCGMGTIRKWLYVTLGVVVLVGAVSFYKYSSAGDLLPIRANIPYYLKVGAQTTNDSLNIKSPTINTATLCLAYLNKILMLFKSIEITNNINFSFAKSIYSPLNYLLGPVFIIPLSICGMTVLVMNRNSFRKAAVIFFYFFAFATPLVFYIPLGRYRIILIPVFAIMAAYFLDYVFSNLLVLRQNRKETIGLILFYLCVLLLSTPSSLPIRVEDYIVLSRVLTKFGEDNKKIENYLRLGRFLDPNSSTIVEDYADFLMRNNRFPEAVALLVPFFQKHQDDFNIKMRFVAALLGVGQSNNAILVLEKSKVPDKLHQKVNFYYHFAEAYRLSKDYPKAVRRYEEVLKNDVNHEFHPIVSQKITECRKLAEQTNSQSER